MIEARELTKRYGDTTAVHSLSFTIAPGTVTGFLGPNGAGKSTTMRMIMGLDRPTSGTVTVNGKPYRQHRAPLREVGALLEASAVHPGRSARSHLRAMAATHNIKASRPAAKRGEVPTSGERCGYERTEHTIPSQLLLAGGHEDGVQIRVPEQHVGKTIAVRSVEPDPPVWRVHHHHASRPRRGSQTIAHPAQPGQRSAPSLGDLAKHGQHLGCQHHVRDPHRSRVGVNALNQGRKPSKNQTGVRAVTPTDVLSQGRQQQRAGAASWIAHQAGKRRCSWP